MKLINEHKKWMRKKQLPTSGLCLTLEDTEYADTLELFSPDNQQARKLREDGEPQGFWGYGGNLRAALLMDLCNGYTDRRQTIVLLICAMHGEL